MIIYKEMDEVTILRWLIVRGIMKHINHLLFKRLVDEKELRDETMEAYLEYFQLFPQIEEYAKTKHPNALTYELDMIYHNNLSFITEEVKRLATYQGHEPYFTKFFYKSQFIWVGLPNK